MTPDSGPPHAATPELQAGTAAEAASTDGPRQDLSIAGVIGLQLSDPLGSMQNIVQDFVRTGKISRAQVQLLSAAIESARGIAMQSQQLARLSVGRLRQSHEKLRLDIVLSQSLAEHMPMFQRSGIQLQQQIAPVQVILDASLLSSLIDAAIEWSAVCQHRLEVSLERRLEPESARLAFRSSPLSEAGAHVSPMTGEFERLSWHLLTEIARTIGVTVHRADATGQTVLSIEFPRTVQQSDVASRADVESGGDSWMHSESVVFVGHHVLLVTAHAALRAETERICDSMGLVFDWAAHSADAERQCLQQKPDIVVVDERSVDDALERLQHSLLQADAAFPWIEIAKDSHSLSMELWMNDREQRLTLNNLRTQLPLSLLQGLSKARAR